MATAGREAILWQLTRPTGNTTKRDIRLSNGSRADLLQSRQRLRIYLFMS
jgi:hypothetical protein